MWQGFTESARRVIYFAQEEAAWLGESCVGTEHLLLGMLREEDCTAYRLLIKMGIDPARIRSEVLRQAPQSEKLLDHDMALCPGCEKVVSFANIEAKALNSEQVAAEHLLLGLIREREGLGGRVLVALGLSVEALRAEIKSRAEH